MNIEESIQNKSYFSSLQGKKSFSELEGIPMITVGMGTCGIGNGAELVYETLQKKIEDSKFTCKLQKAG